MVARALPTLVLVAACGGRPVNPPVVAEPAWDSPRTRELAKRACFDCHSNETVWPVYTTLPLIGGSVRDHVLEGREKLNFSEWNRPWEEAGEAVEVILEGEMPLRSYLFAHPEANLGRADRQALIDGLRATLGVGDGGEEGDGDPGADRAAADEDDDHDDDDQD